MNTLTSGTENNLKQATQLERRMVLDWGMSERFNHLALGGRNQQVFLGEEIAQRRDYGEKTAREIDEEIMKILDESFNRSIDVLSEHRTELDNLAEMLVEREEVSGEAVLGLVRTTSNPQEGANRVGVVEREEKKDGPVPK